MESVAEQHQNITENVPEIETTKPDTTSKINQLQDDLLSVPTNFEQSEQLENVHSNTESNMTEIDGNDRFLVSSVSDSVNQSISEDAEIPNIDDANENSSITENELNSTLDNAANELMATTTSTQETTDGSSPQTVEQLNVVPPAVESIPMDVDDEGLRIGNPDTSFSQLQNENDTSETSPPALTTETLPEIESEKSPKLTEIPQLEASTIVEEPQSSNVDAEDKTQEGDIIEADKIEKDEADKIEKDEADKIEKDEADKIEKDEASKIEKDEADKIEKDEADTKEEDGTEKDETDKENSTADQSKITTTSTEKDSTNVQDSNQTNENMDQDNFDFVHVTENEKEDNDKSAGGSDLQALQPYEPQEDPIASDGFEPDISIPMDEDSNNVMDGAEQGADEELCIIPDTERIISQEEKDAASAMAPLRDPTETGGIFNSSSIGEPSKDMSTDALKDPESTTGKYIVTASTDENVNTCAQCCLPRKSKYTVILEEDRTSYICDDNCLNAFKIQYGDKVIINNEGDLRVKNLTSGVNNDNMIAKVNFVRKCTECSKNINNEEMNLSWETMDFCNELCLSKHQKKVGSHCANCSVDVRANCLGKYCVRFGYDIRQFCSSVCLEEYKKGLKVCSYCQKDMSGGGDGFLAPVGDKGQFKDFCTQQCMEKYDIMSNNRKPTSKPGSSCSVCLKEKAITIEFEHDNKMNLFCGEPCFVAFKFVNNITPGKCGMCRKYFDNKILEENSMYYDGAQHSFCSKSCQNIYIIAHRKIVPCSWCKVKKYNFDMIKRSCNSGQILMMCSLNCLSLYQVSINAVHSKKINCDHCLKNLQPLYHLTMSDATIRNFCSYSCVMAFQNQFGKTPITLNESDDLSANSPVPTGGPKRSRRAGLTKIVEPRELRLLKKPPPADKPTIPVISSVKSLATTNGPSSGTTRSTRSKTNSSVIPPSPKIQIKQQYIFKSSPLPSQRNCATMCKVMQSTKGINCKPTVFNKETQTDEVKDKTVIIPIPVPIYVPTPMAMYSMPFPVPTPFPLPVPVPIFIPTTRNSANGIMKEIKKIQVKIPTDPFEAELLMMAEMVAGDKKEEHTDSESEEEEAPPPEEAFSPEPVDASNTFGDDMLQMALKMATELDEPAVDLEGALTASTITASQVGDAPVGTEEAVDDPQPIHHMIERQTIRGRKRGMRQTRSTTSKRGRRMANQVDMPLMAPPQTTTPQEPVEKPDANMCLKYTFGVNAWKQWVTTKNAELEKSSRRAKLFKPEILQLTADELNYSLCLFVKEVRKPNGQEYAPDTIYYLCLGIQQYLLENGRIDNIFCDAYYEKFTDCLDEVARKFSVLYNDSHYIVTRVEEEHLWESKQLGAHSPHVLLSTLMFFNTKHFNLTTVDEHMQLSFSHIMKHWKRNPNQPGTNKVPGSRNVLLRFYPPQTSLEANSRKKKVYEQQENEENPLRCPVKLYEFYLSKCPESVKTRNDVFYLMPERSCVPDSPVWYSTMPLPRNALEKMLHRVKMVKEINVALLTS